MSSAQGAVTPAESLHEAIRKARRPFTAAAVKWKVQTNPKSPDGPATVVAFIDARLAGERLNAVDLAWSTRYAAVPGGLLCTITVKDPGTDQVLVERSDVGWSSGTGDNMSLKTLYSDAFKRAAVHLGVGVSIYALPLKRLYAKDGHIKVTTKGEGRNVKHQAYITAAGEKALDKHYADWLAQVGTTQFGEPIDHGDVAGAQGDVESTDSQSREDLASEPAAKAAKPAENKAEEPKAEAEDKPISAKGVEAIITALVGSGKTTGDLMNYLVAKGIDLKLDGSMEDSFKPLTASQGRALHAWLKRAAQ